jgi:hypothetical protein
MATALQTNVVGNIDYINLPTLLTKSQLNTIITNKDGTPDFLAKNILWDNLRSWFSPMKQYQSDGNVILDYQVLPKMCNFISIYVIGLI